MINAREFVRRAEAFYKESTQENHRFRSWEHCYCAFQKAFKQQERGQKPDVDNLCLHLAFYLASWGMYRGSSFLLQRDYRIHMKSVETVLDEDYKDLREIKCNRLIALLKPDDNPLMDVIERVGHSYPESPSLTLITKILLGTLGCVPAYDRFLKDALKDNGFKAVWTKKSFKESLKQLCEYYESNCVLFDNAVNGMKMGNVICPQMKFIDMGLWKLGSEGENGN